MTAEAERGTLIDEIQTLLRAVFAPGGPPPIGALQHELTMAQFRALLVLAHAAPLAIGALGERLGVGLPAASRIVDRMVQDGLVARADDPTDRRRALVRLAPGGQSAIEQIELGRQSRLDRVRRLMLRLPDDKLIQLKGALAALAKLAADEPVE